MRTSVTLCAGYNNWRRPQNFSTPSCAFFCRRLMSVKPVNRMQTVPITIFAISQSVRPFASPMTKIMRRVRPLRPSPVNVSLVPSPVRVMMNAPASPSVFLDQTRHLRPHAHRKTKNAPKYYQASQYKRTASTSQRSVTKTPHVVRVSNAFFSTPHAQSLCLRLHETVPKMKNVQYSSQKNPPANRAQWALAIPQ